MKKTLIVLALLGAASTCLAQKDVLTSFSVTSTLTFPSANPNTTPIVAGSGSVTATILITNPAQKSVTLTIQAGGANLVSAAGDTIAVGNITWDAPSATWVHSRPPQIQAFWNAEQGPKALTASVATVITGNDGQAKSTTDTVTGTVTSNFTLQNSWLYSTGDYTQTVTWTSFQNVTRV
jgi:hypothetical protein